MPSKVNLVFLILLLSALVAASLIVRSARHAQEIATHKQRYQALDRDYATNYVAIIADEQRRMAHVEAWIHERDELKRLGFLTERDISFNPQWSKETAADFRRMVETAHFHDAAFWTYQNSFLGTNQPKVIRVWATPADMLVWEQIIATFQSRTNK